MDRRTFIALLGSTATAPCPARAQPSERRRLIGLLGAVSESEMRSNAAAFRERLRERGWIEGRNLTIEVRAAGGDFAQLDADARRFVAAGADVIVALGSPGLVAAKRHTGTLPIVLTMVADPVGQGLIASLSHPGGNATGLTNFEFNIGGKWLELLLLISGGLSRVCLIVNPGNTNTARFVEAIGEAGRARGIEVDPVAVTNAAEIEAAIVAAGNRPGSGLIVFPDSLAIVHHAMIIRLAEQYRLPAAYPFRLFAVNGGLMAYGLDFAVIYRQAAEYAEQESCAA